MNWLRGQLGKAWREAEGLNLFLALFVFLVGVVLYWLLPAKSEGYAVASTAALFIAFVAYPWQKERDRRLKISEEGRVHCVRFVEQCLEVLRMIDEEKQRLQENKIDCEALLGFAAKFNDIARVLRDEQTLLRLAVNSKNILRAAQEVEDAILAIAGGMRDRVHDDPALSGKAVISEADVRDILTQFLSKAATSLEGKLGELVVLMRTQEFSFEPITLRHRASLKGKELDGGLSR